jgi:hypothetical protein
LLPSGGFFVSGLPRLALHGINSDSAGNYQLIDEESTGRISSADCQHSPSTGFCRELRSYQLIEVESIVRMGFLPGITSSGTRNPPEEGDSIGNYQLILLGFRPVISKLAKNPSNGKNSRISSSISYTYTDNTNFKKNLNTKTSLK